MLVEDFNTNPHKKSESSSDDFSVMPWQKLYKTIQYILSVQQSDGAIPWFSNGKLDPWDHVEAAMGLTVGGEFSAARDAYNWLWKMQLTDGSWYSHYEKNEPQQLHHRETHFVAYIATGLWHYGVVSDDWQYVETNFDNMADAINFVLSHQAPTGEIYWAVNEKGESQRDALITASSSVYKSLACAIMIAQKIHRDVPMWKSAYLKLGEALRNKPECFDKTWEPKTRFSMDWFYPVLSGVFSAKASVARLESRWQEFVHEPLGCRCVNDEPWVTVAESCELLLALCAIGENKKAQKLFSQLFSLQDADGGFWTGINFRDNVIWPEEKTTWTAGAVLLAADAIYNYSNASTLFTTLQN